MKTWYVAQETRGHENHGWLNAKHTFSFANYFDRNRMHFGALRVLNDDWIAPNRGFGMHPHDNMEIITIPFSGALLHKDSMGNEGVIRAGDIQVMSAGTGVLHSEASNGGDEPTTLFQIWVFPNKQNVTPRYDQLHIADYAKKNDFQQIISPNPEDDGLWVHQDTWFNLADFDKGVEKTYNLHMPETHGVYVQVIEGEVEVAGKKLNPRDGLSVYETTNFDIKALTDAKVLLMEVPMEFR